MDVVIRRAGSSDVPDISRIEDASFASPWNSSEIAKDVADEGAYFAVAETGGVTAAYAEMRMVAGEAQIYNIAVDPASRGRGLGEALMMHMADTARDAGCDVMTLEVRSGNEAAYSLYKKLGFREVGRRKGYYAASGEDALLMDLNLTGDMLR